MCRKCDSLFCRFRIGTSAQRKKELVSPSILKAKAEESCKRFRISEFYHITPWRNVESILEHGLFCDDLIRSRGIKFESFANAGIKERRITKKVDCTMDLYSSEFVPLFFATRTPMLYTTTLDDARVPQREVVYRCIDPMILTEIGVRFSDGNVAANMTAVFDDLEDLARLDWDNIRAPSWIRSDPDETKEARRVKSAEVLVPVRVESSGIRRIVVYEKAVQDSLKTKLRGLQIPIEIRREFYF